MKTIDTLAPNFFMKSSKGNEFRVRVFTKAKASQTNLYGVN